MARKASGKFNKPGEVARKTAWNGAKTRKWEMTYKLIEVKPKKKITKKKGEPKPAAIKKARGIVAKSKKTTSKKKILKRKKKG